MRGRKKKPRKKVDLHGSSWLREQEDNRKRALAQAADGLNRKVNGKCKEHTAVSGKHEAFIWSTHTMFSQKKNVLQRKSETWLLNNPTEFKIVYNHQKLQNGVFVSGPPSPKGLLRNLQSFMIFPLDITACIGEMRDQVGGSQH